MRISLVFLGSVSAGPIYSFQMAKAMSEIKDIQLQIVISNRVENIDAWDNAFAGNDNIDYHKIETYKHNLFALASSFFSYSRISRLVKAVKQFNPDVTYFPFGCMWAPLAFPVIHKFSKIVCTYHDPHPYTHGYIWSQYIQVLIGKPAKKYTDGIIILNQRDKGYVEQSEKKPVAVVPHAAYSFYVADDNKTSNVINKQIAFFGRIDVYKGVDVLVDAFLKVKTNNLKLLIAGSGTIDNITLQKIKSNSNIITENRYIENDEIARLMENTDIVVLPYTNASQSGVIPMAFAFGKMVIATNVGALSEQVPSGTGVLVEVCSDAIAEAIDNIYSTPEKILEFGRNAKRYADIALSWNHSAALVIDFCKQLCK